MKQVEKMAICANAVCRYGMEQQAWKAAEEFGELITAVAKRQEAKAGTPEEKVARQNLLDEMADASIMLMQLRVIECISEEQLEDRITYKLGRLVGRMNDG